MDSQTVKIADNSRTEKRRNSQQTSGSILSHKTPRAEPDNKYYEVEVILDGPRKRREHLFKYCYKVRWKGYGPEADTWQPIADLANVEDMIEEYKKEKAMKQREKGKTKPSEKINCIGTRRSGSQSQMPSSSDSDDSDDDKQYDPVYGTVKDKFWKDLELGRHQNHAQLFCGDMYSKVKGCRRAAHADAVTNIQRQQQTLNKPQPITSSTPRLSTKFGSGSLQPKPKFSQRLSSKSASFSTSKSQIYTPASRVRKRSADPFSARGYMSAKRSRRSRARNQSPDGKKWSSIFKSETSVDNSNLEKSPPELEAVDTSQQLQTDIGSSTCVPPSNLDVTDHSSCNGIVDKSVSESVLDKDLNCSITSQINKQTSVPSQMISVNSLCMDIDTNCASEQLESLDCDKISSGVSSNVSGDITCKLVDKGASCVAQSSSGNFGASGSDPNAVPSLDAEGATSEETLSSPSVINITLSPKRSFLDAQSEASGAVERSHDEDCLWNGACNRSDCKSNRRRNMKNCHRECCGMMNPGFESVDQVTREENFLLNIESKNTSNIISNEEDANHKNCGKQIELHKCEHVDNSNIDYEGLQNENNKNFSFKSADLSSAGNLHDDTSQLSSVVRTPHQKSFKEINNLTTQQAKVVGHILSNKSTSKLSSTSSKTINSQPHSLLYLYQAESSDSSFDEIPSSNSLSKEAVTDSFCQKNPIGQHQIQADINSPICSIIVPSPSPISVSLEGDTSMGIIEVKKNNSETERPGLFSDNNSAFKFTRQDSGFSGGSGSATPGDYLGQFMLPSTTGSICSPGKENFGSSSSKSSGLTAADICNRLQLPIADAPKTYSDPISNVQSLSVQPRLFCEPSENRVIRKRSNEVSQPLEKIPSPNLRVSEFDKRINTLTCDELEDFLVQGEENCVQKEVAFISNADLLQAVNLNKTDVVKYAIRQFQVTEHRLDFEQPDSTGLTLLMRAVQKGAVAIVEMLLEHGVNVNAQQTNGNTSLMIAANMNSVCLVALLLKYGANSSLYTVDTDRAETALMKAIKRQHVDVVSLMVRVGVNIAAPTSTSISALELAIEHRNPHIERIIRHHCQQLDEAFQSRVLATLEGTAELVEPLFPLHCFPLRESHQFVVKFNSVNHPVAPGEGFLLFIAHTKITDAGIRCRFHGGCPIGSVTLNGILQTPLTKEVNFVTSCHPVIQGCNVLIIHKMADYTSKAKLVVQAFRARLLPL